MLFNSIQFAVFFPIVFVIYWLFPPRYQWLCILISSYYFYMSWNIKYIVLIIFTTAISYISAIVLESNISKRWKKIVLVGTIILCLGILFYFKYFNFFSDNIVAFCKLISLDMHPATVRLFLPVGISFYTFQTFSYVIDVYRGEIKAEKHLGKYAAFVSFFPQLVAGPIERASNLLPQIKKVHKFNYIEATYGLKLMAWGFFKKVVIADNLAVYVDKIYGRIGEWKLLDAGMDSWNIGGGGIFLATIFFSIQIYCDFSGYSDIAMGTAKIMGINLMKNFSSPYCSSSVKEFWSRWHISLSTWFRDYIYIPLGGNRCNNFRHTLNLMITFLVSGFWHGANWTFIVWGGIHGLAQAVEHYMFLYKKRKRTLLSTISVFGFCTFAWIFFRAENISDAIWILQHIFDGVMYNPLMFLKNGFRVMGLGKLRLFELGSAIVLLIAYDFANLKIDVIAAIGELSAHVRWGVYYLFVILIIYMGSFGSSQFIYFQF